MTLREHLKAARHHLREAIREYPNNSELDGFTQSCLRAQRDALRAETFFLKASSRCVSSDLLHQLTDVLQQLEQHQ
jgi:hypothetical protein